MSTSLYCTVMSDTVGVLWRAGSGTVDPWTKNMLVCCQNTSMVQAGANPVCAAKLSSSDVTKTLSTTPNGGADPSQFWCGLKNSVSSAFCLTNNLGKSILYIAIGAILLLVAFNYLMRPK